MLDLFEKRFFEIFHSNGIVGYSRTKELLMFQRDEKTTFTVMDYVETAKNYL